MKFGQVLINSGTRKAGKRLLRDYPGLREVSEDSLWYYGPAQLADSKELTISGKKYKTLVLR